MSTPPSRLGHPHSHARGAPVQIERVIPHRLCLRLALVLLGLCPGCAQTAEPVTLSSWQRSVERYIWDEGNGDPNVLRDMSWDDVHKGFSIVSDPQPARSTDAIGLLVGRRFVGQTGCFVFLVGLVNHQELQDLRPVALQVQAGHFHWAVGPPDQQALSVYRRRVTDDVSESGDRSVLPVFPRGADVFKIDVQGRQIFITNQPTGATWTLNVPSTTAPSTRSTLASG